MKKKTRIRKIFKWTLLSILILFVLFIVSAFLFAKFYENAIKKLFVSELNKRLQTEISVRDIRFSFLKQFPLATLEFQGLVAKDATSREVKDTLLQAAVLQLSFNIRDIYRKKYEIKRINLKEAAVKLKVYKDLNDNFHCWKAPEGPSAAGFTFSLQKVVLNNVSLRYSNQAANQVYAFFLKQVKGKGNFSQQQFDLKISGNGKANSVRSGKVEYVQDKPFKLNTSLAVNQETGRYTFSKGELEIGSIEMNIKGFLVYLDKQKTLGLQFETPRTDLENLLTSLPAEYTDALKDYRLKGFVSLKIEASGHFGGKDIPDIRASFQLDQGSVTYSKKNVSLKNLSLHGSYQNQASVKDGIQQLSIRNLHASLNQGTLDASLSVRGFNPSLVDLEVTADLSLADLVDFLPSEKIVEADGNFSFKMNYQGEIRSLDSLTSNDFIRGRFSGDLDIKNIDWEMKDHTLSGQKLTGSLAFDNNDVEVKKMEGSVNGNDFLLEGYFTNLVPFLLSESEDLEVNARLHSASLDLRSMIIEKRSGKDTTFLLAFPDRWAGAVEMHIDQLRFGTFHGSKVSCDLNYRGKKLVIDELSMTMAAGQFSGKGLIDGSDGKDFQINAEADIRQVDLSELFKAFDNFGQDYIVASNLKGATVATIQAAFRMRPDLSIDPASLISSIDIRVEQGELIDFKPISRVGKYLKIEDLSRVRFSTLKNNIYIKDQVVTIPSMEVISDAVNFNISGTHTFRNEINYRFQILLSEILARRAKKAKKETEAFGIVQDDGSGRTTLYLLMTGTVDNPVFKYDSKGVTGKIITNFLNERDNLQDMLKREFTLTKKEQDSAGAREDFIRQQQENGRFVADWENNISDSLSLKKPDTRKPSKETKKKPVQKEFSVEWEEDDPRK